MEPSFSDKSCGTNNVELAEHAEYSRDIAHQRYNATTGVMSTPGWEVLQANRSIRTVSDKTPKGFVKENVLDDEETNNGRMAYN